MTAKDQALLLFTDIGKCLDTEIKFKQDGETHTFDKVVAKKIATLMVDKLIELSEFFDENEGTSFGKEKYWKRVKEELNQL